MRVILSHDRAIDVICLIMRIGKMAELAKCTEIHRRLSAYSIRHSTADFRLVEIYADLV